MLLMRSVASIPVALAPAALSLGIIVWSWPNISWLLPTTPVGFYVVNCWMLGATILGGFLAGHVAGRAPIMHALVAGLVMAAVDTLFDSGPETTTSLLWLILFITAMVLGGAIVAWRRRAAA